MIQSLLGTELKINVHVEPIGEMHMSAYNFKCEFYVYSNRVVTIHKEQMRMVDDDNYIAMLTSDMSKQLGRGDMHMVVTAEIPDADFEDGFRTEKQQVCVGVTIV
jgi:hypothetical protein